MLGVSGSWERGCNTQISFSCIQRGVEPIQLLQILLQDGSAKLPCSGRPRIYVALEKNHVQVQERPTRWSAQQLHSLRNVRLFIRLV